MRQQGTSVWRDKRASVRHATADSKHEVTENDFKKRKEKGERRRNDAKEKEEEDEIMQRPSGRKQQES